MANDYPDSSMVLGRRKRSDRRKFYNPNYSGIEKRIAKDRRLDIDKRKSLRYRVNDIVFLKFYSKNNEDMGKLLDISKGGAAVRYLVKSAIPSDYQKFDIFSTKDGFAIPSIPFTTVSDIELTGKKSSQPIPIRRYGLQFTNLTTDQISKLDDFLEKYTFGEA